MEQVRLDRIATMLQIIVLSLYFTENRYTLFGMSL